jgi:hypothetical protein
MASILGAAASLRNSDSYASHFATQVSDDEIARTTRMLVLGMALMLLVALTNLIFALNPPKPSQVLPIDEEEEATGEEDTQDGDDEGASYDGEDTQDGDDEESDGDDEESDGDDEESDGGNEDADA